jgi:RNA polymerase sigma factor (sigma-70 family)
MGDSSIAQLLYDQLQPTIEYALSRVLRHRNSDLDDLVQVTFERVIRAIAADRFSGQSALTTWTAAIAGHVAIDYLRRSQVERRLFSDALPLEPRIASSGVYWTERSLEARSEIQRLHAALSRMKPALAETVVLHDVLGHNVEEVAALTGASQAATRSRLFRGRKELLRQTGGRKAAP